MRSPRFVAVVMTIALAACTSQEANSAPTLGFMETWTSNTSGWGGGAVSGITFSNPLTGGADGGGFLKMSVAGSGNFGTRSNGPEYTGDWMAAGINRIRVKLNDLGSNDNHIIHLSVGAQTNLWQYNLGFIPGPGTWAEFVVDLSDSNGFTRIVGSGSFAGALQNANTVHLRHDLPPFSQTPDFSSGDLGIDDLLLTSSTVGIGDVPRGGLVPIELAAPSPNPSRGPVALTMRASEGSPIQMRIIDIQGRLVRSAVLAGGAGIRVWMWDGRDQSGRDVPAGSYRVIAKSQAGGTSRSLVRVR